MKKLIATIILLTFLMPYSSDRLQAGQGSNDFRSFPSRAETPEVVITSLADHESPASTFNQSGSATYSVTFEATWSNETHPHANFPASAHFSSLIGATHDADTTFWQAGALASEGIERMAETGGTSTLRNEVEAQIAQNNALALLSGSNVPSSPGSATIDSFEVNQSFPFVTLVTMIAPSPDWFVGVSTLSLLDQEGEWVASQVVTLYPYDAGTDSGPDYASPNEDTEPQEAIARMRGEFPFSVQPIGTFTFTRLDAPELKSKIFLPLLQR